MYIFFIGEVYIIVRINLKLVHSPLRHSLLSKWATKSAPSFMSATREISPDGETSIHNCFHMPRGNRPNVYSIEIFLTAFFFFF